MSNTQRRSRKKEEIKENLKVSLLFFPLSFYLSCPQSKIYTKWVFSVSEFFACVCFFSPQILKKSLPQFSYMGFAQKKGHPTSRILIPKKGKKNCAPGGQAPLFIKGDQENKKEVERERWGEKRVKKRRIQTHTMKGGNGWPIGK